MVEVPKRKPKEKAPEKKGTTPAAGELPIDIEKTPLGIAAEQLKQLRDEEAVLSGKISAAKAELLRLLKEQKRRSITASGLKLTVKPGIDVLEIKNA